MHGPWRERRAAARLARHGPAGEAQQARAYVTWPSRNALNPHTERPCTPPYPQRATARCARVVTPCQTHTHGKRCVTPQSVSTTQTVTARFTAPLLPLSSTKPRYLSAEVTYARRTTGGQMTLDTGNTWSAQAPRPQCRCTMSAYYPPQEGKSADYISMGVIQRTNACLHAASTRHPVSTGA